MIENALMWMVSAIGQIVYETCKILAQIVARVFITAFDMLFAGFALVIHQIPLCLRVCY